MGDGRWVVVDGYKSPREFTDHTATRFVEHPFRGDGGEGGKMMMMVTMAKVMMTNGRHECR